MQRLVPRCRDQLIEPIGRAPSGGENDDTRHKNLLNSGINFAQQYHLRLGVALSAEQIRHLTSDIVWMETQTVSLPDGRVEQVRVPKVYRTSKLRMSLISNILAALLSNKKP